MEQKNNKFTSWILCLFRMPAINDDSVVTNTMLS